MDKKILIGSIITICILVGVSFTSVVGYHSVESNIEASPLFNIRSSRTIDEEREELRCEYVGKGEVSILPLPIRDNKIERIQRFIERICKMDDETFNKFINLAIGRFKQDNNIDDETISETISLIKQIRKKPLAPADYKIFQKNNSDSKLNSYYWTWCDETFLCGGTCLTDYICPIVWLLLLPFVLLLGPPFLLLTIIAGCTFVIIEC